MTPRHHRRANRALATWHRRLGVTAAAVLVLLVATGLLLQHGHGLGLDRRYIQSNWLLNWYGIEAPAPRGVALGAHWVSEVGERIYLDQRELAAVRGALHGAVAMADVIAIGAGEALWLLTPRGEIVEQLGTAQGTPKGLRAVGVDRGRLVVQAHDGNYAVDLDASRWRRVSTGEANWSRPGALPETLAAALVQQYRGRGLSAERVLADLHGGRLFGALGVWLVDLTAIACLGLALTGLWTWARKR